LPERERAFPKALGLLGDFYHPRAGLETLFRTSGPQFSWTVTGALDAPWSALSAFQVLVIALEDRVDPEHSSAGWMTAAHAQALAAFVEAGGGLLAFHSGLAYPVPGPFPALAGGAFQFHPTVHPHFRFDPRREPHPLLEGVPAFDVEDEMYFVWRDPTTDKLAELASAEFGTSAALWCSQRGAGRVVGLTLGHRPEVLALAPTRRLAANALAWLAPGGERDR
jgi:type 1 glutamine amidotransferase